MHRRQLALPALALALASLVGAGCIEVETLKEKREAECRAVANPDQYARTYTVSTTCEGERASTVTVRKLSFVEVEDSRAELGVRQYFRGEFENADAPFWTEGRIEVECTDGSVEGVLIIESAAAPNTDFRCFPTLGGAPECSEFNALSMNPAPAGCTASIQ